MKLKRPQSPRLLPVVIFAGLALLAFKGIGLLTHGAYVLAGTEVAQAAEAAADPTTPDADHAPPGTEPTMADASPTIDDASPTLATKPDAPAPGEAVAPAGGGAMGTAAAGPAATPPANPLAVANSIAAVPADGAAMPTMAGAAPAAGAMASAAPAPAGAAAVPATAAASPAGTAPAAAATTMPAAAADASGAPATAAANGGLDPACPPPTTADTEGKGSMVVLPPPGTNCDAVPVSMDASGNRTPLVGAGGGSLTEQTLNARLAQRRAELDKREADLSLRAATVAAAEKQMRDHADALKALEAQVAQSNTDQKTADDTQFAAVVKMYETMKPQEAAAIFDGLDMTVLMKIIRAIDPRKMAAILPKLSASRAQEVTVQLADAQPAAPATTTATADPNALPQIVGH